MNTQIAIGSKGTVQIQSGGNITITRSQTDRTWLTIPNTVDISMDDWSVLRLGLTEEDGSYLRDELIRLFGDA